MTSITELPAVIAASDPAETRKLLAFLIDRIDVSVDIIPEQERHGRKTYQLNADATKIAFYHPLHNLFPISSNGKQVITLE